MTHHSNRSRLLASSLLAGLVTFGAPAAVATIALTLPAIAAAQDLTTGTLVGTVVDDTGAPISGATVTIRSERAPKQTLTTDATGGFRLPQAAIGAYSLDITAPGRQGTTTGDVMVNLGSVSNYTFPLAASTGVSELVVTTRRQPNVEFDQVTTGIVVDVQQAAERLPVTRDIQGIVNLAPQITINRAFGRAANKTSGDASISGSSPAENIYYINGMNVTNFRNFLGGSVIPFEFYDQVQVKTGGYSAEYGRSTGGAIIAATRSGSNTFHGGLNAFWSPKEAHSKSPDANVTSQLTVATQTYTNKQNLGLESQNENLEGNIWLSGPVIKDHLFFFGFYNPRHTREVSGTGADGANANPNTINDKTPTVYDVVDRDKPFYGGKIDAVAGGQRLELTYFKDLEDSLDTNYVLTGGSGSTAAYSSSVTSNLSGGDNKIAKYTGRFTDWFTLSALYGETGFQQSSIGSLDSQASVLHETLGLVRGNPNLTIASGTDLRKNYRLDADFYFNLFGDHHVRAGYDREDLTATQAQSYSGGVYYRYYPTGQDCGGSGTISTLAQGCVRVRRLSNVGTFNIQQQGIYLQDAWDFNDRLSFQIGVRNEDFNNKNAGGDTFIRTKNQLAPRLGVTYDVFGDKSTKLSGFYGRYYLPVAGNTNIRGSGGEIFLEDYYLYTARDATTLVPTLGTRLIHRCLEGADNGTNCLPEYPAADELTGAGLKPQYQDEFIAGIEHQFSSGKFDGWSAGLTYIHRDLKGIIEDANINNPLGWAANAPRLSNYCVYAAIPVAECGSFGNSGYVILNPGENLTIRLNSTWGGGRAGTLVTIPAAVLDLPKPKRVYDALEFKFARPFDGKWGLDGSYVLSRSKGNYEGGTKSDTGQADTGGTTDYDQPGYMDGSNGLLPNDHTHQFKLHSVYAIGDALRLGVTGSIISPRHYGCLGYFPVGAPTAAGGVPRADTTHLNTFYCLGTLNPRGSRFEGAWIWNLDMNATYDIKMGLPGKLQARIDAFNLFNLKGAVISDEYGETGSVGTRNYSYTLPSTYQQPRYVRVGLNYSF